jgi:hypothetical protein
MMNVKHFHIATAVALMGLLIWIPTSHSAQEQTKHNYVTKDTD